MNPLGFLVLATALAAAPFRAAVDAGAQQGEVYLQGRILLVGAADQEGRPGFELTDHRRSITLPEDLSTYRQLGQRCDRDASRSLTPPVDPAAGRRAVAWTQGDMDGDDGEELVLVEAGAVDPGNLLPYAPLSLALYRGGERVGEQALDLVAFPCELGLADVDRDGSDELILVWLSAGGSGWTRGATVFELEAQP